MASLALFFVFAFIAPSLCQIHLGPEGNLNSVTCYHCDGHGHNVFPDCLNKKHDCHHDEVCKIKYGNNHPEIRCQKAEDCYRETSHPMRNCTGGGVEIHHNECQKCCGDDTCTDDLTSLLKLEFEQTPNLFCPGECTSADVSLCITHGHHCTKEQFCQVSKDEHGRIRGECKEDHEYHHCTDELVHHPCDHDVGHGHGHHGHCIWDCCDTDACLSQHFGAYMTTMQPSTTMATATTMAPAGNQSLWERLNGNCDDQLQADQCKALAGPQDVCHDRLALSICPKTCGLCDAINSTVCKDIVKNDGCMNLMANEDVCNDGLAVFICPKTCNKCDELVNSVITSLVDGDSTATDVPPSLLPPSVNPSDFPTFNCNDLAGEPCSVLDSLCAQSFVKVVCPDACKSCSAPIVTVPTTMMTSDSETSTMQHPTQPSMAPITSDDTPSSTMPPTSAPSSSANPPVSTLQVGLGVSPTSLCIDHLNGMNCADLKDVCQSVMALSVCPKYCGLC